MITADIEDVKTLSGTKLTHHYGSGQIWCLIYNLSSTEITQLVGTPAFGIFKDNENSFSIFITDILPAADPTSQSAYRGSRTTIWGTSITTPYFNVNNLQDTVSAVSD